MTTMSPPRGGFGWTLGLLLVGLSGCPTSNGGTCLGNGPFTLFAPKVVCSKGTLEEENVDCAFCCSQTGQTCTAATAKGETAGFPCCSGSCTDGGLCACGSAFARCAENSDCCGGACNDAGTCACVSSAGACSADDDCCGKSCTDAGACACSDVFSTCVTSVDCCQGLACAGGQCARADAGS